MTVEQAKELCVKAHKGQWRRPIEVDGENNTYLDEVMENSDGDDQEYLCEDGTLIKNIHTITWTILTPYSLHPIEVADMMDSDEEKTTGYLHDIIEDTDYGIAAFIEDYSKENIYAIVLRDKNYYISENIYNALKLLTKSKNQPYQEYIENISKNKLATKVKIADITCNLLDNPSENQKKKYRQAMKTLLKDK